MRVLPVLFLLTFCLPAQAALSVFATVPEWGALTKELGENRVDVFVATTALQDPHRIEAKPSLIARARRAQLVIATGAELEIGWLPMVQRESGNAAIQAGKPGYFEAADFVSKLEIPVQIDRAEGHVHAQGNPHFQLDPRRILKIAEALSRRLIQLDPAGEADYQKSFDAFSKRWKTAITNWEKLAAPLRGQPVLAQHTAFSYLLDWLGIPLSGTLEVKPGVEPSSGQLVDILARQKQNPARMILHPAYQDDRLVRWVGDRTGQPVLTLPFTVGGTPKAKDLWGLFDDSIAQMLKALQKPGTESAS